MVSSIEASGESEARTPKGKRGIKKKANAVEELASIAEGSQEQPTATGSGRVTRNRVVNNNNNNEVLKSPSPLLTPPKRIYNRKKKIEEPEIAVEAQETPKTPETPVSETKSSPRKGRSIAVVTTPEVEHKKPEVALKTLEVEPKKRGRKKKVEVAPIIDPAALSDSDDDEPLVKLSSPVTPEMTKKSIKLTLKTPKVTKTPEKVEKTPQSTPEVVTKRTRKTAKSSVIEMDEDGLPEVTQSTPEVTPVKRGRKSKAQIVEPEQVMAQSTPEITSTTPQTSEEPTKRSKKTVKLAVPEIIEDKKPEVIKTYGRKRKADSQIPETPEIPAIPAIQPQIPEVEEAVVIAPVPQKRAYNRKKKTEPEPEIVVAPPASTEPPKSYGRKKKVVTIAPEVVAEVKAPVPPKTYSRKRKAVDEDPEASTNVVDSTVAVNLSLRSEDSSALSLISLASVPTSTTGSSEVSSTPRDIEPEIQFPVPEYKHKKLLKRNYQESKPNPQIEAATISPAKTQSPARAESVKMVISKKKGSIFKSRTLKDDELKKRQIYKHQWGDQDEEEGENASKKSDVTTTTTKSTIYDDFDGESSGLTRVVKKPVHR